MLALGWRHSDIAVERAIEGGIAAVIAAPFAAAVTYALSTAFPLGVPRSFEPDPGLRADWLVIGVGVAALTVVAVATGAIIGARRLDAPERDDVGGIGRAAVARGRSMPTVMGARFATSGTHGRGSWGSLVAGIVAMPIGQKRRGSPDRVRATVAPTTVVFDGTRRWWRRPTWVFAFWYGPAGPFGSTHLDNLLPDRKAAAAHAQWALSWVPAHRRSSCSQVWVGFVRWSSPRWPLGCWPCRPYREQLRGLSLRPMTPVWSAAMRKTTGHHR
jgi:hypothetical protein